MHGITRGVSLDRVIETRNKRGLIRYSLRFPLGKLFFHQLFRWLWNFREQPLPRRGRGYVKTPDDERETSFRYAVSRIRSERQNYTSGTMKNCTIIERDVTCEASTLTVASLVSSKRADNFFFVNKCRTRMKIKIL